MIIVVEGIDRVGKTTLCNKLKDDLSNFNVFIFKDERMKELEQLKNYQKLEPAMSSMNTIINMYQQLRDNKVENVTFILDRFHATEYVYGVLERNYFPGVAKDYFDAIEKKLEQLETLDGEEYLFVLVEPIDLDKSSQEHGKELRMHQTVFDALFNMIPENNKMKTDFNHLDETAKEIERRVYESWI